ncbi:MAG: cation:proton antiporter [Candidatus Jettenia sp. CY-1]|nr:MAG: cation:proton antiporter [Candidatus Jettenia sp. CY-1]
MKNSQQIPAYNEKDTKSIAEAKSFFLGKFLKILKEKNLQKKPSDEGYQPIIAEQDIRPPLFPQLLYTTSVGEQFRFRQERGTQTVATDTGYPQTIPEKENPIASPIKEGDDGIQKELFPNKDHQLITTEKEIGSSNTEENISHTTMAQERPVTSDSEVQLPSLEGHETQTLTPDKKSLPDIAGNKISSPSDTANDKSSQENFPPKKDDQNIAIEKKISPATSPSELLTPSFDKGMALVEKEKGTQTSMINNEQERNIPGEKEITSSEEEKSPVDYQSDITGKEISQDMKENSNASIPSEPHTTTGNEKEVLSTPTSESIGNSEVKPLDSGYEQKITSEKKVASDDKGLSVISPEVLSIPSVDKGESLVKEESEIQASTKDNEQQRAVLEEKHAVEITKEREEVKSPWSIWHKDPTHNVILAVAITLIAAKIGGWIARMVKFSEVVGNLVIGIILGNIFTFTGWDFFYFLKTMPFLKMISYFGTLILLFTVGLHVDLRALLQVGTSSLLVCMGGMIAPAGLGLMVGHFFLPDTSVGTKLILAIILCNTATGLKLAVLKELKAINSLEGRVITGATVLTDIVVFLTFGVVSGFAVSGGVSLIGMSVSFGIAIASLIISGIIILRYSEKFGNFLTSRMTEGANIPIVVILSLLLAFMFGSIGLHTIMGAFVAGLFLRNVKLRNFDDGEHRNVESFIRPFYMILVPILFVRVGAQVDLKSFLNIEALPLIFAITGAAVIGKMFCSVCPIEKGINRLAVGLAMVMKMDGTLIVSGIARDMGMLNDAVFSSIIVVIVITSTICPSLLKASLVRQKKRLSRNFRITVDEKTKETFIRFKNEVLE